jgi:hypothetical protein
MVPACCTGWEPEAGSSRFRRRYQAVMALFGRERRERENRADRGNLSGNGAGSWRGIMVYMINI